jgi:hypothetical protein
MKKLEIPSDILDLIGTTIKISGNKHFTQNGEKYYVLKHGNGHIYEMDGDERPEGIRVWRDGQYIGDIKTRI